MVPLPGELQVDAAVFEALAVQPAGQPGLAEQPDGAVLQYPGALPRLAVGPAADLHDHRVDAAQREQVRQQQPGRAGADDAYLGARACRGSVSFGGPPSRPAAGGGHACG